MVEFPAWPADDEMWASWGRNCFYIVGVGRAEHLQVSWPYCILFPGMNTSSLLYETLDTRHESIVSDYIAWVFACTVLEGE
jgi:hypothetical protein